MKDKGKISGKPDFTWDFKIDLKTSKKVVFFKSPSHSIVVRSQTADGTQTLLEMEKS
jgi:hypothetical protein